MNQIITNKHPSILELSPLQDVHGAVLVLRPKGEAGDHKEISAETAAHEIIERVKTAKWIDMAPAQAADVEPVSSTATTQPLPPVSDADIADAAGVVETKTVIESAPDALPDVAPELPLVPAVEPPSVEAITEPVVEQPVAAPVVEQPEPAPVTETASTSTQSKNKRNR